MGNYLTQTGGSGATGDLTNAIGNERLSILCPDSSGYVSSAACTEVIDDAEAEVDSILGPGFTVPTTSPSVPRVVKLCAKNIATHFAYRRVTEFRDEQGRAGCFADYEQAIKRLKELRSGMRDMGDETSSKSAQVPGTVYASTQKFIVDSDETTTTGPTGGF